MVDFDAAVAAVQDPNADPVFLAKIAYENPEFGANVVANPRAVSEQVQYQMPSEQVQYQPEPFAATPASNVANDASTEYVDPYTNPADLSEVADFSPIQPQEPVTSNAGFTAELAMTTEDQMLMAEIASKAPELHPFLARNPHIYPDLLNWLASLNDSAINAAIRLRQ